VAGRSSTGRIRSCLGFVRRHASLKQSDLEDGRSFLFPISELELRRALGAGWRLLAAQRSSHGFEKLVAVCYRDPRVPQFQEKNADIFIGRFFGTGSAFCSLFPGVFNCRAHRAPHCPNDRRFIIHRQPARVCLLSDSSEPLPSTPINSLCCDSRYHLGVGQ
jgi:hypothetical protein